METRVPVERRANIGIIIRMLRKLEAGAYYGSTTHLLERDGLSISDTRFAANLIIPPHEHANAFFCFVLSGQGTHSWPAGSAGEAKMNLTLFPAEVPHANCWYGTGGRVLHIEFARSWLERLGSHSRLLHGPGDFARGRPVWLAQQVADELHHRDDVTELAVEGLVLELLAACARWRSGALAGTAPHWLREVRAQLHDRVAEHLSLAELARSAGVSADHMMRMFRRHYGCTLGEYVRDLRIEFARGALERTEKSLADIAGAAGFADQSHMTREFRRKLGVTPARYRETCGARRSRSRR
jgi:AraC family transcriptional regulator